MILNISSYLTKIHHIKGRIRVRVSAKIKEEAKGITLEDITGLPDKIDGIHEVKINKSIGSVKITYDHTKFPYDLWEDLLANRNLEEIAGILNQLAKEVA